MLTSEIRYFKPISFYAKKTYDFGGYLSVDALAQLSVSGLEKKIERRGMSSRCSWGGRVRERKGWWVGGGVREEGRGGGGEGG